MVISLPRPLVIRKETAAEKVIEIRVPNTTDILKKNKVLAAFFTVLSAPVK